MPENSKDEMILITVSWQALQNLLEEPDNRVYFVTNSIVTKFFAATYIEASLNYIIEEMKIKDEMALFYGGSGKRNYNFGLGDKLAYFYNKYVEKINPVTKNKLRSKGFKRFIEYVFIDFYKIKEYRDKVAHGKVIVSDETQEDIVEFRRESKDIVMQIIKIAEKNGLPKTAKISFLEAIGVDEKTWENFERVPRFDVPLSS